MGQKHAKPAESPRSESTLSETLGGPDRFEVILDIKNLVKEGNSQFQEGRFMTASTLYSRSLCRLYSEGFKQHILKAEEGQTSSEDDLNGELDESEINRILAYADQLALKVTLAIETMKDKEQAPPDFDDGNSGLVDLILGLDHKKSDDLEYLQSYAIATADLLNNVAAVQFILKQTKSSLQMNYKTLKLRALVHGGNSIAAAESLQNISSCLDALQDLESAEKRLQKAIEIESMHGLDGTVESTSMLNNLGILYSHMHRWDQAEAILLNVLQHREDKLGKDHRLTKNATSNLEAIRAGRLNSKNLSEDAKEDVGSDRGEEGAHEQLSPFPPSIMDDVESPHFVGSKRVESSEG